MTKIKVCGLTDKKEASYLNAQQVDFAGFVLFFPKSKRNLTITQAKEIMNDLDPAIKKVAVVVSPSIEQIKEIQEANFDIIQIHGSLPDAVLNEISIPILKAFNISDMEHYPIYQKCEKIKGYVFDAQEPGSGKTFDWKLVTNIPRDHKLLLLAGGLTPNNVSQAIAALHPDGFDVSSGVEFTDKPGKDPEKIEQFIHAVRTWEK